MKFSNNMIDNTVDIGRVRMLLASFLFVVCHAIPAVGCPVDEIRDETILAQASELVALADDLQNEIKTHLTRVRGQGKMRGLNSQVRGRTTAVIRRIKRNPNYGTLSQDLEKLVELTGRLNVSFNELRLRPDQNRKSPGMDVTRRVSARITRMSELAGSIRTLRVNGFPPLTAPSRTIPEYDPRADIAPGFAPTLNAPTQSAPTLIAPASNAPTLDGPLAPDGQKIIVPAPEPQQPRIYSVLEK